MGKIGLFGGTFDPVHNGHIALAEQVLSEFSLDKILFLPAGNPPHKQGARIVDALHRFSMVTLAAAHNPRFSVSRFELDRTEPNYSYKTISHFKETFPDDEIFFLVGADSFRDFPDWKCYRTLLTLCTFLVVPRPGISGTQYLEKFCGDEPPPRVFFLKNFAYDISSTQIRARIQNGESISHLVSPAVEEYIKTHKLYR